MDASNEEAIENGRSVSSPRSTLQNRRKRSDKSGSLLDRNPVFSIIKLSKLFYGVTQNEIKHCASTSTSTSKLEEYG
ncbi:hypothetical protein ILUMI_06093 [Ignelater luminosus]|uniref:Uncharacterized protein n=1 Tax=Ignelater luminosus TaxID=2038154 RepID=A0A8K0D5X9_IGNLU|nr:hypothetical protein ILUMI_06093 [Ignelater luminosus]